MLQIKYKLLADLRRGNDRQGGQAPPSLSLVFIHLVILICSKHKIGKCMQNMFVPSPIGACQEPPLVGINRVKNPRQRFVEYDMNKSEFFFITESKGKNSHIS